MPNPKMNRRHLLAGAAAVPLLPVAATAALPANVTEAVGQAFLAADAEYDALNAACDAAWDALPEVIDRPEPTVSLPSVWGNGARTVTAAEIQEARRHDPLLRPASEDLLQTMRDMLEKEEKLLKMRTPEAIAEREALYDRLEAELAEKMPAKPEGREHVNRLSAEADAAADRRSAAEDLILPAPVLTVEDAARKLQLALEHMCEDDWDGKLVASALDGLRRLA